MYIRVSVCVTFFFNCSLASCHTYPDRNKITSREMRESFFRNCKHLKNFHSGGTKELFKNAHSEENYVILFEQLYIDRNNV